MKIDVSYAPKELRFVYSDLEISVYINDIKFGSIKPHADGMVDVSPSHPFLGFEHNFWLTRFKSTKEAVEAMQRLFDKFWLSISESKTVFVR